MSAQENLASVKEIFEQFSTVGNLDPFYDAFGDEAVFEMVIPTDLDLPPVSRGKAGLRGYFEQADKLLEFKGMHVQDFLANDTTVVAFGDETLLIRESGRIVSTPWVLIFRFTNGQIASVRAFENLTSCA